jgi:CMP-N,N'-diacetyllegionaminic acid synthase
VRDAGLVLAIVPARGGSKGLPGKNLRPLAGRSLVARAVDVAHASGVVDRVVVSTDDAAIAAEARTAGAEVPFMRPSSLATDEAPMRGVVEHALEALRVAGWQPGIVVLLQPTAPLRRPAHVRDAVEALRAGTADAVASVVALPLHLSPDYVMRIEGGALRPFLPEGAGVSRRQDARPAYVRDGTVYAFRPATLARYGTIYGELCLPLLIPADESVTIDTADDWDDAERRWRSREA